MGAGWPTTRAWGGICESFVLCSHSGSLCTRLSHSPSSRPFVLKISDSPKVYVLSSIFSPWVNRLTNGILVF